MAIALSDPEIEMVQGKYCICGEKKSFPLEKEKQITHATTNQEVRESLFLCNQLATAAWNKLVKRSLILNHRLFFKDGILYEDQLWQFYLMKNVKNAYYLSDVTYHYRRRPGSICTGTDNKTSAYHRCIVYQEILDHLTPENETEEFRYYARVFSTLLLRFSYSYPAMKDVFLQYWKKSKQLKNNNACILLGLCYILGKFKYGWVVMSILIRITPPHHHSQ